MVRVLPQPAPCLEEVLQNLGQAPAVAPLLQNQKLPQPGRRLGSAHAPPLRPGGEPVQNAPVVVLRQPPDCPAVRLRRLPGPPQRPADRLHIPGLPLPAGALAVSPLDKLGGALRSAHVLLAPCPDVSPVKGQIAGLRQQLPDQRVGPPPPLQQGGGPVFSSAASRHGAFSSLSCAVALLSSIAEAGKIFNRGSRRSMNWAAAAGPAPGCAGAGAGWRRGTRTARPPPSGERAR